VCEREKEEEEQREGGNKRGSKGGKEQGREGREVIRKSNGGEPDKCTLYSCMEISQGKPFVQ
jgi:hypothetical protein